GYAARVALDRGIRERAVETPNATVIGVKQNVRVARHSSHGVLVRVPAHAIGIYGHVCEIDACVLRALDRPAVRRRMCGEYFVVLHRAPDVNDVWRAWWRIDRHIIRALTAAVVVGGEAGRARGRTGQRSPANVAGSVEQRSRRDVCIVHPVQGAQSVSVCVTEVDAKVGAVGSKRELCARIERARVRARRRRWRVATTPRLEDLTEAINGCAPGVRRPSAENAVVEERGVDLRLRNGSCYPVELDVRATAAEEVTAVRATREYGVLGKNHGGNKRRPTVSRFVEADLG